MRRKTERHAPKMLYGSYSQVCGAIFLAFITHFGWLYGTNAMEISRTLTFKGPPLRIPFPRVLLSSRPKEEMDHMTIVKVMSGFFVHRNFSLVDGVLVLATRGLF